MKNLTSENLRPTTYDLRERSGFTLLEMIIYSALFSVAAVTFITVLVSVTRIQVRQSAATEVGQQSLFLLQTIQRYVESSSLVETLSDTSTSTLKLRMPSSTDPTTIYLSGGVVYVQETTTGTAQALSSAKVNVTDLTFVKRTHDSGRDSVNVSFVMEYNTSSTQNQFVQGLETSIARVSAATFDSNLVPQTSNTYKLGAAAQDWQSVNETIYFSSSNVGIGVSSPASTLQVSGGDIYVDTVAKGLILRDAGGGCWRVSVNASGTLTTASLACP